MSRNRTFAPRLNTLESRNLMAVSVLAVGNTIQVVADVAASNTLVSVSYTDPTHANVDVYARDSSGFAHLTVPATSLSEVDYSGNNGMNMFVNATDVNDKAKGGNGFNYFLAEGNGDNDFTGGDGVNTFLAFGSGKDSFTGGRGYNVFYAPESATFVTGPGSVNYEFKY